MDLPPATVERTMRILVINQYFPPDASNSAHILGELAEDLARHHEVQVLAGTPSYNTGSSTFRPSGVEVVRVGSAHFNRSSLLGRCANYASFCLLAPLRALTLPAADLVVTMTDPPMVGLVGVLVAHRRRRPLVQITHDVYPEMAVALGKLSSPVVIRAWRRMNRTVRSAAASIVVVGRDMKERLVADGVSPAKIVVVPNWASEQPLDEGSRQVVRERMSWSDRFVVMHAGNAGLAQNLDVMLDAAAALRDDAGTLLVILGDGAAKAALERRVSQEGLRNVDFLSHRPKAEAQELMAAADVHVITLVPGLWGCATPGKTYGIMAAGRPFIAVVDEGSEPARIAAEFHCGVHVPAGDGAGLAAAIRRMRTSPLDAAGARGLEAFRSHYTRERATAAMCRHLEDVAAGRGA
jgi:colanic acid biosynthesis glycosyl transferase WcaI